jgi:hypothetical protein
MSYAPDSSVLAQPAIPCAQDALVQQIDALHKTILCMETRLEPILSPPAITKISQQEQISAKVGAPIAEWLRERTCRVAEIDGILRALLARVEL